MNSVSLVCHFCQTELNRSDFERGRAVTVLRRNYCSKCMAEAIRNGRSPDHPPQFRTPRPKTLSHLKVPVRENNG